MPIDLDRGLQLRGLQLAREVEDDNHPIPKKGSIIGQIADQGISKYMMRAAYKIQYTESLRKQKHYLINLGSKRD